MAGCGLERIVRAAIHAIGGAVVVAVGLRIAAAALQRCDLQRVVRAGIDAIGRGVSVRVHLHVAAAACAGCLLERIVRAGVGVVGHVVRRRCARGYAAGRSIAEAVAVAVRPVRHEGESIIHAIRAVVVQTVANLGCTRVDVLVGIVAVTSEQHGTGWLGAS